MKINKFFLLGLAGLAFAACSNEDEATDSALLNGTKQVTVTINAGNYAGPRAGSGWTGDGGTVINATDITVYFLNAAGEIKRTETAVVGSDNLYTGVDKSVTQIAAVANCTGAPTLGNWSAVSGYQLDVDNKAAANAPLFASAVGLTPAGADTDGNTKYTATLTLKTMLTRFELSGTLTCTDLGTDAYSSLTLTHVGLNGVYTKHTLAGASAGNKVKDESNQTGYPTASIPACFYDQVSGPMINNTTATPLGAGFGYNTLGKPDEFLLKFTTAFKTPVTSGFIVYNPAYLKIVDYKNADGDKVTIEPGKIYQITNLEFTEEDLTDLDPGEPTISVAATVNVVNWEIVAVTPEYGK